MAPRARRITATNSGVVMIPLRFVANSSRIAPKNAVAPIRERRPASRAAALKYTVWS